MAAIIKKDGDYHLVEPDDEFDTILRISDRIPPGLVPLYPDQEQPRWEETLLSPGARARPPDRVG